MKVIDYMNDLHAECLSPYIEFFMDGDSSVYLLKAYEYHGCHRDSYSIKVFTTPERAWNACQQLKSSLLELPVEKNDFALRWDDKLCVFDWEFLTHDSK